MDTDPRGRTPDPAPLVPVALLVLALALRPQLSAIGPLAQGIMGDLGTSHAFAGLLTAVPVLCMGLFAPAGTRLAHATGVRSGIALSAAIIVGFGIGRALAPTAELVLLLTFGVGFGTAVVGPMLPMFVRGRLALRLVAGTAAYAAGMNAGAAIASALAVPLATALGGWRGSLLALSVASLAAIAVWLVLVPRGRTGARHSAEPHGSGSARRRMPVRRPIAWAIGILFGLQSTMFYGINAWLPSVYVEHGWAPESAALLLTLSGVVGLLAIVAVPIASRHGASRRQLLVAASVATAVALAGVAVVPAPAVLWATLLGIGLSMAFTLVLTLPTDISDDPAEAGGAAALMLLVGYLMASAAPFLLGAARDMTGSFTAGMLLLLLVALVMLPLSWSLSPERLRAATPVAPAPAR